MPNPKVCSSWSVDQADEVSEAVHSGCFHNPNGTSGACFSVARKNWKPALTAAVLLTHLLDAEPKQNRQIISGARSCD